MPGSKWYAEDHEMPTSWGWVIILLFSASIMGFGWLVYCIVPDAARQWDFGQLPDTPAESIFSTEQPRVPETPRRQLPQLPEAQPLPAAPQKSGGGTSR